MRRSYHEMRANYYTPSERHSLCEDRHLLGILSTGMGCASGMTC